MSDFHTLGLEGETLAVEYLEQRGFQILERNWRSGHKEIDIIAAKGDCVHFVEVKTRSTALWGTPEASVTASKRKLIILAANHYIQKNNIAKEARFDVISILKKQESSSVDYMPDAYSFTRR